MALQIIKVITEPRFSDKLIELTERPEIIEAWQHLDKTKQRIHASILIHPQDVQKIIDKLETTCGRTSDTHILVVPISASLSPKLKEIEEEEHKKTISKTVPIAREQLYKEVLAGTKLDMNYILLVLLSTIVASLGLLENNVTVVIGAMVIAPLLGPNLALSLATTLGDWQLMVRAVRANLSGIIICLAPAFLIGLIWPYGFDSMQLLMRTDLSYDSLVFALASGAAAVLSLTAGLSSTLVGVMVAAALLPPLATTGIMLGVRNFHFAAGAGLLFAANIICINLVANITFLIRGIRPSRWYEKQKAKKAVRWNLLFWTILLLILAIMIYLRHGLTFIEILNGDPF